MAKFCTKCGKALVEGQVCDCQTAQNNATVVTTTNSNGFDFNQALNNYIEIVKGIFTKPIDTIKKFSTSSNFILGMIALVVNCIVSGIFLYCLCNEAIGLFSSLMGELMGYGSMFMGSSSIEVPFMDVFLYGFASMAAGFVTTALMIYLVAGVILKDKIDIKKAFSLVGTVSVFTTVTTVVSILLTYVSIKFMLVVLLLAGIFYLTYLYQGINETTEVDKNKLAYVFVPTLAVATFVVVYILPKIFF